MYIMRKNFDKGGLVLLSFELLVCPPRMCMPAMLSPPGIINTESATSNTRLCLHISLKPPAQGEILRQLEYKLERSFGIAPLAFWCTVSLNPRTRLLAKEDEEAYQLALKKARRLQTQETKRLTALLSTGSASDLRIGMSTYVRPRAYAEDILEHHEHIIHAFHNTV